MIFKTGKNICSIFSIQRHYTNYFYLVLIYVSIGTLCQLYAVCQFLELINSSTETISLIICINYKYQKLNIQNRSDMAHDK